VFAYMSSNKAFLSPLCYRLCFLEDFRLRWCALWFKKIRFYKHHIKCILLNLSFFKNQNYILNINKLLFLSVYIEKKQWSPALLPFCFCHCIYSNSRGSIFQLFINSMYYLLRYLFHMWMQF